MFGTRGTPGTTKARAARTGGENSEATSLDDAKRHCVAAIVRQGWAPGGWEVRW